MKKYNQYKDSGVEWIGQIPEHWEVMKGNRFLQEAKEKNTGFKRETVLSLSYGNIRVKEKQEQTGLMPESYETYQLVDEGDIIFRPTDLQNDKVSLRSAISNYEGIITSAYINIRAKSNADKKFCAYLFRAIDNNKIIYGLGSGLRQNINFDDFKKFIFAVPPLSEQTAIAHFLDQKTQDLDTAISQKQKLISLLEERKQIIIQDAVTKGINKNVEMKESGIEWIGKIPKHWEVKRLASFGRFSKGGGFSKSELTETGVKAILYGDIYTKYNIKIDKAVRHVSEETANKSIPIHKGDLLLTGSGETVEDIGKCVVYNSEEKTVAGGDVILFKQYSNDSLFVSYCLNAEGAKGERAKTAKGEIIVHTYGSKLREIFITIPPLSEQQQIVSHIESASKKIDESISLQKKQIKKLKEYKSVLIDAAVTGKIKVS